MIFQTGYHVVFFGLSETTAPEEIGQPGFPVSIKVVLDSAVVNPARMINLLDSEITEPYSLPGALHGVPWATYPSYSLLADAQLSGPLPSGATPPPAIPLTAADRAMKLRHGGRWQMSFCDGHAESGKPKKFFNFTDDEVTKLWSIDNQVHKLF